MTPVILGAPICRYMLLCGKTSRTGRNWEKRFGLPLGLGTESLSPLLISGLLSSLKTALCPVVMGGGELCTPQCQDGEAGLVSTGGQLRMGLCLSSSTGNRVCVVAKLNCPPGLWNEIPKTLPLFGLRFCHPCTHTTNGLTTVQLSHGEKELHLLRQGYLPNCTCLQFSVQSWEVPGRAAEGYSGHLANGEA